MTLWHAAAEIATFLEEKGIDYVILGGLAVQHWGEPRATHDIESWFLKSAWNNLPRRYCKDFVPASPMR